MMKEKYGIRGKLELEGSKLINIEQLKPLQVQNMTTKGFTKVQMTYHKNKIIDDENHPQTLRASTTHPEYFKETSTNNQRSVK